MTDNRPVKGVTSTPKRSHATRALVLGLLSLPFGVFAPFAIWAAISAMRRIRRSQGVLTGETAAVFGLVAGILGMTTFVVGTAYWLLAP